MITEFKKEKHELEQEILTKILKFKEKFDVEIEDVEFEKICFGRVLQSEPSFSYEFKIKVSFDAI